LSAAGATETLRWKDVIGEELEAPNYFDGEEKTSHKSLPEVLERKEAGNGVCCSWLVRAGLGEQAPQTRASVFTAKSQLVSHVGASSPGALLKWPLGFAEAASPPVAVVPAWRQGPEGDGDGESDVLWGGA